MPETEKRVFEAESLSVPSLALDKKKEGKEEQSLSELLKTVKQQKANLERLLNERKKK